MEINQNEIRDIIVRELKNEFNGQEILGLCGELEARFLYAVDNIISKLPKWEVIASGNMQFNSQECFYSVGKVPIIYTPYVKILEKLAKYLGKQIELGIRIKKS